MTKHDPIKPNATESDPAKGRKRSASLFERADAAFGLDRMGSAGVPGDLPEIEPRVPEPVRRASATQRAPDSVAAPAQAAPDPMVAPQPARPEPETPRAHRVPLSGPLHQIDREVLASAGLIVPEEPITQLLEEFRIVKRELLADARRAATPLARRILVSSPHTGEGKTFCAANLAIALAAERDIEMLLIDCDVMKPSISRRFGLPEAPGFIDALSDRGVRAEELALATDIDRLFVMPAGTSSSRDAEFLASARTGQVLDRLTQGAPNRFVIFDTPPALAASPAAELAAHVGQTVLIVRADQTSRAALDDAQQLLSACRDIKLLLNATHFSPSGRRFGRYEGTEE
ncbi:MAG: AAA family ATPase [Pseudomonadota bacterium]